jgi:nucleoside-triphosphatase THEP1
VQERPGSPAALILGILADRERDSRLVLVTGDSGSGKTTWCLQLIEHSRQNGIRVYGVVSPPVFEAGHKVGIDLMDVSTNERRRLAAVRQAAKQKLANKPDISTLHWTFDPMVLAWGNQILDLLDAGELLVLDELGPLELLENKGLTAGVKCIDDQRFMATCVVIRTALLPTALERWPQAQVIKLGEIVQ